MVCVHRFVLNELKDVGYLMFSPLIYEVIGVKYINCPLMAQNKIVIPNHLQRYRHKYL